MRQIKAADIDDVEILAKTIRESFRDVAVRFGLTPVNCPRHPSNCTEEWIRSDLARGVRYLMNCIWNRMIAAEYF